MTDPKRIGPHPAHRLERSADALLVCAYEDESKFQKSRLEGAISLGEFHSKKSRLDKDANIVFY